VSIEVPYPPQKKNQVVKKKKGEGGGGGSSYLAIQYDMVESKERCRLKLLMNS
jgi:hypothetical protein